MNVQYLRYILARKRIIINSKEALEYNFYIMGRLIYTRSNNMTKDEFRTNLNNLGEMFELVTETCYVAFSLCGDENR